MRQLKYIVYIPIPSSEPVEYKEYKFHDKQDVLDFLEIKANTFLRICDGTLQCKHKTVQRLHGIKIVRQESVRPKKITPDVIKQEADAFAYKLINKT